MALSATIIRMVAPSTAIQSAIKTAARESNSFFETVTSTKALPATPNAVSFSEKLPEKIVGNFNFNSIFKSINEILGPDKFSKFNNPNLKKFVSSEYENYAKKFINSEPELLFVCEYIVDDNSVGLLLVWERMRGATHYEIFKKNLFSESDKFERVLFLDALSLEEEMTYYIDYVQNTLGISLNQEEIFIISDTSIKEDRIYEYKIKAARVPKEAKEIDYDFVLTGRQLVNEVAVDDVSRNTIFDMAAITLGSKDLAWTIAIMNETLPFFGRGPFEKSLGAANLPLNADQDKFVLMAIDNDDIVKIFNESVSLFDLKSTVINLLLSLGGLPIDFRDAFIDSIDEIAGTFSYDFFKKEIRSKSPVFNLVLNVAESAASKNFSVTNKLSKLSIKLPSETGSESFSSFEKLTKILNFVNTTFLAVLYAQDDSQKLSELLEEIEVFVSPPDPVDLAVASLSTKTVGDVVGVIAGSILDIQGSQVAIASIPASVSIVAQAIESTPRAASIDAVFGGSVTAAAATATATATPAVSPAVASVETPSISASVIASPISITSEVKLSQADVIAGPAPTSTTSVVSRLSGPTSTKTTVDVKTSNSTRRGVRIL